MRVTFQQDGALSGGYGCRQRMTFSYFFDKENINPRAYYVFM